MIAVLKRNYDKKQLEQLIAWISGRGPEVRPVLEQDPALLQLTGDLSHLDPALLNSFAIVERVERMTEPYREVGRTAYLNRTVIALHENLKIGDGTFLIMAGPCSIESEEQLRASAAIVKAHGANVLRGGAFKPRTSPYSFQGLGEEGLQLLLKVGKELQLPVVTEILDASQIPLFRDVDIIQVGARNMQNFALLKKLGKLEQPILLKRGFSNTLEELLLSAEYLASEGNSNIILCERGIRTFETATRNTLYLSAIPMLHSMTHLPVVADPSHGTGKAELVPPMALAATAAGADGLLIEVHHDPMQALCDGAQALNAEQFEELIGRIRAIEPFAYRK